MKALSTCKVVLKGKDCVLKVCYRLCDRRSLIKYGTMLVVLKFLVLILHRLKVIFANMVLGCNHCVSRLCFRSNRRHSPIRHTTDTFAFYSLLIAYASHPSPHPLISCPILARRTSVYYLIVCIQSSTPIYLQICQ